MAQSKWQEFLLRLQGQSHPLRFAKLRNYSLLIAFTWYLLLLAPLLFTSEHSSKDLREKYAIDALFFMAFLIQFGFMLYILNITLDFVIRLTTERSVSAWFLLESYMSTIFLFASYYLIIFRIFPDGMSINAASHEDVDNTADSWSAFEVFEAWCQALYFSITVMSMEGFGDITPSMWWTQILVASQQLVGVFYTTLILAKGFDVLDKAGKRAFHAPGLTSSPTVGLDVVITEPTFPAGSSSGSPHSHRVSPRMSAESDYIITPGEAPTLQLLSDHESLDASSPL
mmetsp:Transcript_23671/g.66397  ORF Transcript_23671/g.66397 Transcript_23671/m.66397 type:complete len:285 (+) Transcript_23671:42-896(+)